MTVSYVCAIGSYEYTAQCKLVQSSKGKNLKLSEHCQRRNEHRCVESWNWTDRPSVKVTHLIFSRLAFPELWG